MSQLKFVFIFFLCLASGATEALPMPWRYSLFNYELPATYHEVTTFSMNVGNVGDTIFNSLIGRHCPKYKLCRKATVRSVADYLSMMDADVVLLQETLGIGQLLGTEFFGPLLDEQKYEGYCGKNNCVAWKRTLFSVPQDRSCDATKGYEGEVAVCPLVKKNGSKVVQFISAHIPAINFFNNLEGDKYINSKRELTAILFREQNKMIQHQEPALIGGDFNSSRCTADLECTLPYPENFYTIFGQFTRGYGMRKELLAGVVPEDDFYGAYEDEMPAGKWSHFAFGIPHGIDHVFANFGVPVADPTSSICRHAACIMSDKLPFLNCKYGAVSIDHRGIFSRIAAEF